MLIMSLCRLCERISSSRTGEDEFMIFVGVHKLGISSTGCMLRSSPWGGALTSSQHNITETAFQLSKSRDLSPHARAHTTALTSRHLSDNGVRGLTVPSDQLDMFCHGERQVAGVMRHRLRNRQESRQQEMGVIQLLFSCEKSRVAWIWRVVRELWLIGQAASACR